MIPGNLISLSVFGEVFFFCLFKAYIKHSLVNETLWKGHVDSGFFSAFHYCWPSGKPELASFWPEEMGSNLTVEECASRIVVVGRFSPFPM